jgi:ADP-heptose:LPS heptosyltransferase
VKHHNDRLHALSRRLNPLWRLVAFVLRLDKRAPSLAHPRSILLVDLHLLGDIVMLTTLLRTIRRCHPEAHIALIAGPWAQVILRDTRLVDQFITLRAPWIVKRQGAAGIKAVWRAVRAARRRSWDWGIEVRGDVRNALILALARARRRVAYEFSGGAVLLTDVVPDDGVLRHIIDHHAGIAAALGMHMTNEERIPSLLTAGADRRAVDVTSRPERRIGVHFGASLALRRMPEQEGCDLLARLYGRGGGTKLILIDAPDVRALNSRVLERLRAVGPVNVERWEGSLEDFMIFLQTFDHFYAMDSGPAHLAAAVGVETTVFFGPHRSFAVRPMGPHVRVVERDDLPCRPCDQHRCTNPKYQECLTLVACLIQPSASMISSTPMHGASDQDAVGGLSST